MTSKLALLAVALLAPATGCANEEEFFETDGVDFRDSTSSTGTTGTTGTTAWTCVTCTYNDPEVNGYPIPDLDMAGTLNDAQVRLISITSPGGTAYSVGTIRDEIVALNPNNTIAASGLGLLEWKLQVMTPTVPRVVKITSYDRTISSWKINGKAMSVYGMAYLGDPPFEYWFNICPEYANHPYEATVTVLAGETYDNDNKLVEPNKSTWFTLACRDQAAYKMKRLSYGPHGDYLGPNPTVAAAPDQRQATLKMITADYCGGGTSYTAPGTAVHWANSIGTVQSPSAIPFNAATIEALWNEDGALCLSHPRLATLSDVQAECVLPACTQAMYDAHQWEWVTRKP